MIIQQKSATGSDGYYPRLLITAPTGSVVTVNGIVITGIIGETTDTYTYVCNDYGTYTVVGTLGSSSKTIDVSVDNVRDYSIEVFYKVFLYNQGDECSAVTGGWAYKYRAYSSSYYSNVSYSKTTALFTQASMTGENGWECQSKIDVTNFTKICLVGSVVAPYDSYGATTIVRAVFNPSLISSGYDTSGYSFSYISGSQVKSRSYSSNQSISLELDISAFTGQKYIAIGRQSANRNQVRSYTLSQIWLE